MVKFKSGGGESGCTLAGGIANDCSASNATVQISMADQNKGLAIAYNYASSDNSAGVWYNNASILTVTYRLWEPQIRYLSRVGGNQLIWRRLTYQI